MRAWVVTLLAGCYAPSPATFRAERAQAVPRIARVLACDEYVRAHRNEHRCCGEFQNGTTGARGARLQMFVDPDDLAAGAAGGPRFPVGESGILTLAFGGTLTCKTPNPVDSVSIAEPEARTGVVGLGTQYVGIAFHYLVLYEPAP